MCGIAAILSKRVISRQEIYSLIEKVSHRGPDDLSTLVLPDGKTALAHSRLAIQDLSPSANQPMATKDGKFIIIFNGEIYNFPEVRENLLLRGYTFRTNSDTEVILNAYCEYGAECLSLFNGMWAIVIHNTESGESFIARDRFGVKPLYFYGDSENFLICSEVDAIGKHLRRTTSANQHYLENILKGETQVYSTNDTHLNNVKSLPPGSYALLRPGEPVCPVRWYQLDRKTVPNAFSSQVEAFRELLWDAVSIRLRSDVPIATCLSGGIDSGTIVCVLHDLESTGKSLKSFSHRSYTASFPNTDIDETNLSKIIAQQKGISLDTFVVNCPTPDDLERAITFCDGPMPNLAFFPIWSLYRHIRNNGITVTLDGQGADEMLGGYYIGLDAIVSAWQSRNIFRYLDMVKTYQELHNDAPKWIANDINWLRLYAKSEIKSRLKEQIRVMLNVLGYGRNSISKHPQPSLAPPQIKPNDVNHGDWLAHRLWYQFFTKPLPFLLHQYDRCSMANSVECRMPFMDYRLVEFTFSLPLESRIGHGYTKRILRETMTGLLPNEIRSNKRKTGFNAPFSGWVSGSLKPWINDTLNSKDFIQHSIFNGRSIRDRFLNNETNTHPTNFEHDIWPAIHLYHWERKMRI